MSDRLPCCYGCSMYGHRQGCTCTPRQARLATLPVLSLKRICEGTATIRDWEIAKNAWMDAIR